MKLYFVLSLLAGLSLTSCQDGNFTGAEKVARKPAVESPPTPPPPFDPPPPPTPKCTDQEFSAANGAHFIFMIDNSGSMKKTDCPENSGAEESCGETNREKAILATFDKLEEAYSSAERKLSPSHITVARFTPTGSKQDIVSLKETDFFSAAVLEENRNELSEVLRFNRDPIGGTPYLNAMTLGKEAIETIETESEQTVLILLTDGEATDKSPQAVKDIADSIDAKTFTLRVNDKGQSLQERRDHHYGVIEKFYSRWKTDEYEDLDAYVDDLMGLGQRVADHPIIEISSSQELETAIFEDIVKEVIKECVE